MKNIIRVLLAFIVIPVVLSLVYVNMAEAGVNKYMSNHWACIGLNENKDILVGAYYFPGGWHTDGQLYYNNVQQTGDAYNTFKMYWDGVHMADQSYWDANSFNISSGGLNHTFRIIDWEKKYEFDANQASMPYGFNYWTMVERTAYFKEGNGPLYYWPDNMNMCQPLSTTDGYLGYYDCDQISVMQTQIEAAANYGVDFFAYEMFWNYDGTTEKKNPPTPIDYAFMNATNKNKMRFAFCWSNYNWVIGTQNYSTTALQRFIDFLDSYYFNKSNYLKMNGKPVVYVYNIDKADGGVMRIDSGSSRTAAQVNALLQVMRDRAVANGYAGLYIVGMGTPTAANNYYSGCGFDAITDYHHDAWTADQNYTAALNNVPARWTAYADAVDAPFQPVVNVSVLDTTWDGSYTFTGMEILNHFGMNGENAPDAIGANGACPANFRTLLNSAKNFINGRSDADRVIMLQAWNEWGENNAIEPSQQFGRGYLESIREVMGFNPVVNWSFEDTGTTPWSFWCPGSGTFSKVSADKSKECTGLYVGRISGATQPYTFAYQYIAGNLIGPGSTYRAWVKIKTTNVAGNGARLRMDFRNSSDAIIAVHESDAVTGTTSDFQRVSVTGTIPAGTDHIYIEICGSTDSGPGANSVIDFDDMVFKSLIAYYLPCPSASISSSAKFVTGSGNSTITWSTSNCASAQVYYRVGTSTTETLWQNGTSGSVSFSGTADNVYTFNVYDSTNHTRLLNTCTVVFYPATPSGWVVDDYNDGSLTNTYYSDVSGMTESNGTLKLYTTATDPRFLKYGLSIDTTTYKKLKVRMKVIHGDAAGQLFWYNGTWDENHSKTFTVTNDGQWHEYTIDLTGNGYWTGTVTQVRLDPCTTAGALVEVDYFVAIP